MVSKLHSADCIVSINGSQRIFKWMVRYFSNDILAKTLAKTFYKSTYEKTLWQTVCVTALCSKVWPHCYENDKSTHELPIYALWKVKVSIEHTYHIIFNWTAERWHTFKKGYQRKIWDREMISEKILLSVWLVSNMTTALKYWFPITSWAPWQRQVVARRRQRGWILIYWTHVLLLCSQIFVLYVWV